MQVPCGLSGREFRARVHSAHPRVSLERGQQVGAVEHLNTGALARPLHVAFTDKLLQHMVSGRVSGRRNLAEMHTMPRSIESVPVVSCSNWATFHLIAFFMSFVRWALFAGD